ncbi:hypothetical protein [Alkalihalobacterium chitinilyticum]|uniref:Uncharacterized protein n=1 Tax=Alkalihalobacterium chitinilyticum TaxID=2980103 RepID=A0ABT5V9L7_9BACI|nr:hypothetical protein [Alkalihalobacterium chitinilyticum]MDE5411975.1 hypothetical protein [Alkalihalobacterium chitinilyticum]
MVEKTSNDQAEELRQQVKRRENKQEVDIASLPPRSEYHKHKKNKSRKFRMRFPLIRVLLVLFIILVIAALSSPIWLENL